MDREYGIHDKREATEHVDIVMNWYKTAYEEDKDVKGDNAEAVQQKAEKHICWYLSQPTPEAMVDAYFKPQGVDSKPRDLFALWEWFSGVNMGGSMSYILGMARCRGRAPWTYDTGGPSWRGTKMLKEEVLKYKFKDNLRRFLSEKELAIKDIRDMDPVWIEINEGVYTSKAEIQSWSKNMKMAKSFAINGSNKSITFSVIMEAELPKNQTFLNGELSNRLNVDNSYEHEVIRVSKEPLQVKMYVPLSELFENYFGTNVYNVVSKKNIEDIRNFAVSVFGNETGSRLMSNPDFMKGLIWEWVK